MHSALAAPGARRLLAVGAIHARADGGSLPEPDAGLAWRALPSLAGGKAYRLGKSVRAEEALGTIRGLARTARPRTPTFTATTPQSGRTCVLWV